MLAVSDCRQATATQPPVVTSRFAPEAHLRHQAREVPWTCALGMQLTAAESTFTQVPEPRGQEVHSSLREASSLLPLR